MHAWVEQLSVNLDAGIHYQASFIVVRVTHVTEPSFEPDRQHVCIARNSVSRQNLFVVTSSCTAIIQRGSSARVVDGCPSFTHRSLSAVFTKHSFQTPLPVPMMTLKISEIPSERHISAQDSIHTMCDLS